MPAFEDLRSAFEALISGSASREQCVLVREGLESGQISIATGERAVAVGGSAEGAIIVTGDNSVVLTLDSVGKTAVQKALSGLFPSRLKQLPPDLGDFEGREGSVSQLLSMLDQGGSHAAITAIDGMPGVGKSALAIHVAHRLVDRYPDGQIFVDLGGTSQRPLTPEEAMAKVVRSFEPAAQLPDQSDDLAAVYRSVLSERAAFVVLDNALDASQVRPLLPPSPSAAIITSRRSVALAADQTINLDELNESEAKHLLQTILGSDRANDEELAVMAGLCGYLPLALRVAGTFLVVYRNWTTSEYIAALSDERQRLKRLRMEGDLALDVAASLALSAVQLAREHPGLANRWQVLTVFPQTFDRLAVAVVWGTTPEEARDDLGNLLSRSMVIFDEQRGRFRLHDLMRDVARGDYIDEIDATYTEERKQRILAAGARHAVHFKNVLATAEILYLQGGEAIFAGLALFDLEERNIAAGQEWAAQMAANEAQAARLCSRYPYEGASILNLRWSSREQIAWLKAAVAAAQRLGDKLTEASTLGNIGTAYGQLGKTCHSIMYLDRSLELAREINNRSVEGHALGNLGNAYLTLREPRPAIEFYKQALEISREIGDRRGEATDLGSLGNAYLALNEPRRAIEFYEQALEIKRDIGDRHGEGVILGNLATVYALLGESRLAIDLYEQRFAIAREIGDRRGEGHALFNLAVEIYGLGRHQDAIEKMEAALVVYELFEEPDVEKVRSLLAKWKCES
jgi:tetratricopeptide (TPR) repeat protein